LFDSLDLKFDSGDARRKDTEVIVEEITHLEEIVNRVLSFGKTGDSIHSHCEIDTLVRDTLHLLRLKLEQSRIRTEVITADRALVVEGHKGQLQQVILNLVINAMQAMPDGGEIKVEITRETHRDGDTAAILITDTGTGIPKSLRQSIFDSFLSGRSDGSGLGLAIAKRILKSHRGDIALVDSSRRGTTVRFWLPLAAPEQGR
jgi:signal transduction histidine kinase